MMGIDDSREYQGAISSRLRGRPIESREFAEQEEEEEVSPLLIGS